jgi:NitT/TauT family transport system substrate-binding protein
MRTLRGCWLLFAVISLWPVSLVAQTAPVELQHVELGLGGRTIFSYLPLTLAERLGYFKDVGLAVKFNDFQGGSKSIEALVGGSVDFVAGAYENTLFLQAKGIDLKAVTLLTDRFGLVLGLNKENAAKYRSPQDLKGLKIGVTAPGSAVANALEIILAKGGLTPKDVSIIGVGAGAGAIAAMKSGQIDGIVFSDPAITSLQEEGLLVPIVDSRLEEGQSFLYGGPNANSSVLTTAQYVRDHPQTVQAFVNAMVRTMKWLHQASVDDVVAQVPPDFYGHDKELYRRSLAANKDGFTKDGHLTPELAAQTYGAMARSGRLSGATQLDVAKTIDESFWTKASGS